MRPPPQVAAARAIEARGGPDVAAPPSWFKVYTTYAFAYVYGRRMWFALLITVLAPRVCVVIVVRTGRAMFSQIVTEVAAFGFDTFGNVATAAADHLAEFESAVLNASVGAMPQLAGATLIGFLASSFGAGPRFPALPP